LREWPAQTQKGPVPCPRKTPISMRTCSSCQMSLHPRDRARENPLFNSDAAVDESAIFRRLLQIESIQTLDSQATVRNCFCGNAVEVASVSDDFVQGVQLLLPPLNAWFVRKSVLDEEHVSAGPQNSPHFRHGGVHVGNA